MVSLTKEHILTASKLEIIVASTRPGRVGPSVARWIESQAATQGASTR